MSSSSERPPLEEMTLRQLRKVASELGISRYSRMRKEQMLSAILEIQQRNQQTPQQTPLNEPVSSPSRTLEAQAEVEAAKFNVGQIDRTGGSLATVDETLPDLPDGYGDIRIVLLPRDPQWAYAYWDIPHETKELIRRQGGVRLALRFYDVTDVNLDLQRPHSMQQYECDELAREWYLPVPVSDRDYMIEIGYLTLAGTWLTLARSGSIRIPPIYPADWIDDQFLTIEWDEELRGKTFFKLIQSSKQLEDATTPVHQEAFALAEMAEAQRVAGSVFSSVQQVPEEAVSSYVFPSGVGKWASGAGVSGMSGVGVTGMSGAAAGMSGVGMGSGVGLMSGVGAIGLSGIGLASGVGLGSGVGMSGIGMYTSSGVGMSGAGIAGMSGVGLSGVGIYTASGSNLMSGVGLYTASGIGSGVGMYTTSGVGMSGVGLGVAGMSGVGMSGVGLYTTSGVGMSGVGLYTTSGVGMSGVGLYTTSGMGMSGVGLYTTSGMSMSGVGLYTASGVGLESLPTMSGISMTSGIGMYTTSGIGMSGVGLYTTSGIGMSGIGMSGAGMYTTSGIGMSGIGLYTMSGVGMSGVGFSASAPPIRPRQFWLLADAELIVYGATEPDATVTIGGRPVKLNSDGTFRFQMSFQDGKIDFPIMAVAADGVQTRSIHLKFERETPERRTNTKEEAVQEWLG